MTGTDLRQVLGQVFRPGRINDLAREYGVLERERALDVLGFVLSLILAGGTHDGGRQYDVMRTYVENGAKKVARSAFYAWFNDPIERLLTKLLEEAMLVAMQSKTILPGILSGVSDWRIVDSTTIALDDALIHAWRGTGDYAAIKIHKELSVGHGNLVSYHLSPAREHDCPHLVVDESRRGSGLLVDLGYASHDLLRRCDTHGVRYVIRLKESWKPRVDRIVRGACPKGICKNGDLDILLDNDILLRDGLAIDADVTLGRAKATIAARLVGVPTPKGYCFFLTNLPRKTHGPLQVGDIYRVRWEIEVDNKVDKTGARIDEITARKPTSVRILILASLLNTTLARIIVQREKLSIIAAKKAPADPASRPPLHPTQVVRAMRVCHQVLLAVLQGATPDESVWNRLMSGIQTLGHDPSWRRRPSVLDVIQGLTAPPHPPRGLKKGST